MGTKKGKLLIDDEDKQITVIVKDESGKMLKITVWLSTRTEELKPLIRDFWNVPINQQVLMVDSKVMQDKHNMWYYGLKDGDCLTLVSQKAKEDTEEMGEMVATSNDIPRNSGIFSLVIIPTLGCPQGDKAQSFVFAIDGDKCLSAPKLVEGTMDCASISMELSKSELLKSEMTTQLENAATKRRMRLLKEKLHKRAVRRNKSVAPNTFPCSPRSTRKAASDRSLSLEDEDVGEIHIAKNFSDVSQSHRERSCQCPIFISTLFEQALIDQVDSKGIKRFAVRNRCERQKLAEETDSPETKSLPIRANSEKRPRGRLCDRRCCPQRRMNMCKRRRREQRKDNDVQSKTIAKKSPKGSDEPSPEGVNQISVNKDGSHTTPTRKVERSQQTIKAIVKKLQRM